MVVDAQMMMVGQRRVTICEGLKNRILELYESEALASCLEEGNEEALYILSQLVNMNFTAERVLYLAQQGDTKTISQICKDQLAGMALLSELQRAIFEEALH